jgi:hypothetical protein
MPEETEAKAEVEGPCPRCWRRQRLPLPELGKAQPMDLSSEPPAVTGTCLPARVSLPK